MLFIETLTFTRELPRHFDDDAYAALQAFLSVHPDTGDVIRGTGGIRKIRWTMPGRGKRAAAESSTTGLRRKTTSTYSPFTPRASRMT